jgi:hypothetical protein
VSQPKTPGQQHLAYIAHEGVTRCATCWETVGPTWQAKAAHAGVLRKDKTP